MFTTYFQIWMFLAMSGLLIFAVSTWIMDRRESRRINKHNAIVAIAQRRVQTRFENGQYSTLNEAQTDLEYEIITLHAQL